MNGRGPGELWDSGAQAERTAFAWQRTGLSAVGVGALLVHAHSVLHPLPPWPGVLMMVGGVLIAAVVAPMRYVRVLRAVRAGDGPMSRGIVPGTAVVVLLSIAGTAAALVTG